MYSTSYKRYVTVLLLVIYIVNQTDRAVFGLLMEPVKREFGLSDSELGFLAGPALSLFYATLGIPIARWADRSHRINIMMVAILLWSAIVMLTAAVGKFWQLALARIGVGIGEAGFSAVAQSVIADYHTAGERTRAMSLFMLAIPLGGVVSSLMAGWINEGYGWRAVFIAAGLPGLLLALLLKWTVQEPRRGRTSPATATNDESHPPLRAVFQTLWRRRALRHLAIAMALLNLIAGGVLGWSATFFIRIHEMSTGELGTWLALIAGFGGGVGTWLSGTITRWVRDEQMQTKVLAASAALACLLLIAVLLCPVAIGALLFAFAATGLLSFFYAPSFSLVQGLCAPTMRATMLAIVIFLQILCAGVIGLQLTGIVSDLFQPRFGVESLRWAMMVMTPAALWASLHFWLAGRFIRDDLSQAAINDAAMDVDLDARPAQS